VKVLHVVAGVICDDLGQVLLSQRQPGKRFPGAWEFPGGKLREGESRSQGLARELEEELGVCLESARPLIRYRHAYPDFTVDLDVWRVTRWHGQINAREGQALRWSEIDALGTKELLAADGPIVSALNLPQQVIVSPPGASHGEEEFLESLVGHACPGAWICLRRLDMNAEELLELAASAANRMEASGARLLLHGDPVQIMARFRDMSKDPGGSLEKIVTGFHIPARFAPVMARLKVPDGFQLGISCHFADELKQAVELEATYAFLGPVKETGSHPGQSGMGWQEFESLIRELPIPVYAIGGLGLDDLEDAWAHGAQGIAAIRKLWAR
jgi:8-oxo-dGTP diphosphatase